MTKIETSPNAALALPNAKASLKPEFPASHGTDSPTTWNEPEYSGPPSRLSVRLKANPQLKYLQQRDVCASVAEQLIRLRKYRGKSQSELAADVGTSQSAIARHERGISNMRLNTLGSLLEGLNAVLRVDLIPEEHSNLFWNSPRWWTAVDGARRSSTGKYTWTCSLHDAQDEDAYFIEVGSPEAVEYTYLPLPSSAHMHDVDVVIDEPQEIRWQTVTK